jgi:hypothetical protein
MTAHPFPVSLLFAVPLYPMVPKRSTAIDWKAGNALTHWSSSGPILCSRHAHFQSTFRAFPELKLSLVTASYQLISFCDLWSIAVASLWPSLWGRRHHIHVQPG